MHPDNDPRTFTLLRNNRVSLPMPRDPFAGLSRLLWEHDVTERALRQVVPKRFPVGLRVLVPGRHLAAGGRGLIGGEVDGYHSAQPDVVWVRLDVPAGSEMRRALVPVAELIQANGG